MVEPRPPAATVKFVDEYCQWYEKLFPEVRSFEAFKYLHVGMISEIKRKSLPAIARIAGLENHQPLHHFLTHSPWETQEVRNRRLEFILQVLQGRPIVLIVDETGDKKKGTSTAACETAVYRKLGKNREWNCGSDSVWCFLWNDISITV